MLVLYIFSFRPRLIQPTYTSNIIVENILLKDSPYWTLHLAYTSNVYINNITVVSPIAGIIINGSGLMTDGIDVNCSKNVLIENCRINTGRIKNC
jgi:polygalacturonase